MEEEKNRLGQEGRVGRDPGTAYERTGERL